MSTGTSIEWTEATWNPVRGCVKVSPGCAHCYASTFAERFRGVPGHPYEQGFDLRLVPDKLGEPQHWKKPRRVFVNSMSDLFQDGVPDDYIAEVWKTMATIHRHTYQVLTKRPERMRAILPKLVATFGILPNVWLGVSVENQHFADERIRLLLQTPAAVRFISAEPLIGPVDLATFVNVPTHSPWQTTRLDWVICGGESGPGARPFRLSWALNILRQCRRAHVAAFMKQVGANFVDDVARGADPAFRMLDRKGGDPAEWPDDLRVREFPVSGGGI